MNDSKTAFVKACASFVESVLVGWLLVGWLIKIFSKKN